MKQKYFFDKRPVMTFTESVNSSEPNTIFPNLLISGSTFLKGTDYSVLDVNKSLPVKPRIRYFDESPNDTLTEHKKKMDECEDLSMDWNQIVCLRCRKLGHTDCSNELTKAMKIKWKPEIEYWKMDKGLKAFKRSEVNDDMEMNITYHLKSIVGNIAAKPNSALAIKQKYLKYKKRFKKSHSIYCCHCGDKHKLKECPMRNKRKRAVMSKSTKTSSDSDGSANTNEMTAEELILDALKQNKRLPTKYKKTLNRGLLKRCAKMLKA